MSDFPEVPRRWNKPLHLSFGDDGEVLLQPGTSLKLGRRLFKKVTFSTTKGGNITFRPRLFRLVPIEVVDSREECGYREEPFTKGYHEVSGRFVGKYKNLRFKVL